MIENYFTSENYSERIIRIKGLDGTASYLICGNQKTCLIDTGMGCGSLKNYINNKLNKTVDMVILTHGHLDHCGGVAEFINVPVYLNEIDIPVANKHNVIEKRYAPFKDKGIGILEMQPNINFSITRDLKDGDKFYLGDITLQAIHTPGHTQGMMMILIKEERTILFGDGCGVGVLLCTPDSSTVEEYKEMLEGLKKYENDYDKIIRNHGTCESQKDLLDNVIECCDLILQRKDDKAEVYGAVPEKYKTNDVYYAKAIDPNTLCRIDGKFGNVAYKEDRIFKNKSN